MMDGKRLLSSSAFMMSAALAIALIVNFAGVFPGDVITSDIRSKVTILLLAAMMTVSLSRIPVRNLSPTYKPLSMVRAIILGLIVSSAIPIIGYLILREYPQYADYSTGWVFIAATPFAASVGPLSFILRGDLEHALRSTIYVYIVSLVWIPFIIWALLGEVVNMKDVVITVVEIIGIPLVLSRLITKVKIDGTVMAISLNSIIFFLVFLSVSATNFGGITITLALIFAAIAILRTFVLGNAVEAVERKLIIHWSQRVTDILITSYKNKGIAIALCVAVMGPLVPYAMVAITISIVIEVCWVVFMDSVLFNRKRMNRELERESEISKTG